MQRLAFSFLLVITLFPFPTIIPAKGEEVTLLTEEGYNTIKIIEYLLKERHNNRKFQFDKLQQIITKYLPLRAKVTGNVKCVPNDKSR